MECGVVSRRFAWFGVVSGGLAWFGFGCGVRGWAVAPSSSVCVVGGLHLCVWGGGSFLSSPPVELPSLPSCRRWCLLLLRRVVETTTWNSIVPEQFRVDFVFWSFPCVHLMSFVCILFFVPENCLLFLCFFFCCGTTHLWRWCCSFPPSLLWGAGAFFWWCFPIFYWPCYRLLPGWWWGFFSCLLLVVLPFLTWCSTRCLLRSCYRVEMKYQCNLIRFPSGGWKAPPPRGGKREEQHHPHEEAENAPPPKGGRGKQQPLEGGTKARHHPKQGGGRQQHPPKMRKDKAAPLRREKQLPYPQKDGKGRPSKASTAHKERWREKATPPKRLETPCYTVLLKKSQKHVILKLLIFHFWRIFKLLIFQSGVTTSVIVVVCMITIVMIQIINIVNFFIFGRRARAVFRVVRSVKVFLIFQSVFRGSESFNHPA